MLVEVFEKIICDHLSKAVRLDPFQFAYRTNGSVEDAVSLGIHSILQHLESPGDYTKVLFIYYSSAFNTILPSKLFYKLQNMGVQNSLCHWILDFLQQRTQVVKINNKLSQAKHISTGAPQECVLSPLLYSLYNNDCISHSDSVKMLTSADDTTLIGLMSGDEDSVYRNEVLSLTECCSHHNLELNIAKTKELVVDFRRKRK